MDIKELEIKGIFEVCLQPHKDNRGFFMRSFDKNIFEKYGLNYNWVQENHSRSEKKGTLRGLHFQLPPHSETKLIRCIRGKILDVFVDLRKNSKSFGEWGSVELSEENQKMILLPKGIAHGFCTMADETEILYKVDEFYTPHVEMGIKWNDNNLDIDWPTSSPILSEKDQNNFSLSSFIETYSSL